MANDTDERWLIVGLGNPGANYQRTRHNIGFIVLDAIAEKCEDARFKTNQRFKGELSTARFGRHAVLLLKPTTYMNLSGESVAPLARFYRIPPERCVVLQDEIDLPLGQLRLKQGGGTAGHNGLRSIESHLGSADFIRLRIGVGRPKHGSVSDFVLKPFRAEELETVQTMVDAGVKAVRLTLGRGLVEAMNRVNRSPKKKKKPPKPGAPEEEA